MQTTTVQTLANDALECFETSTRPDGSEFVRVKDGSPDWLHDLCLAAHENGQVLPDDKRYSMIENALSVISNADEDINDAIYSEEAPSYTSELTTWLDSAPFRVSFLTDALTEYGDIKDGFQLLALAWTLEFQEVANSVLAFLESRLED